MQLNSKFNIGDKVWCTSGKEAQELTVHERKRGTGTDSWIDQN